MSNSFFISGFYVLDECQTHDKDDCEEQQCANDGDDFGQDAHTSKFPFRFRARAADRSTLTLLRSAARKRVGKLQCETAFCSETSVWAISTCAALGFNDSFVASVQLERPVPELPAVQYRWGLTVSRRGESRRAAPHRGHASECS